MHRNPYSPGFFFTRTRITWANDQVESVLKTNFDGENTPASIVLNNTCLSTWKLYIFPFITSLTYGRIRKFRCQCNWIIWSYCQTYNYEVGWSFSCIIKWPRMNIYRRWLHIHIEQPCYCHWFYISNCIRFWSIKNTLSHIWWPCIHILRKVQSCCSSLRKESAEYKLTIRRIFLLYVILIISNPRNVLRSKLNIMNTIWYTN